MAKRLDVSKLYDGDEPRVVRFLPPAGFLDGLTARPEGGVRRLSDGRVSLKDTPFNLSLIRAGAPGAELEFSRPSEHVAPQLGAWHPAIYYPRTKSFDHQQEAFDRAKDRAFYALFHEQGCGKTKVAVDIAGYHYARDEISGLLVLTFKGVHRQWIDAMRQHLGFIGDAGGPLSALDLDAAYWDGKGYPKRWTAGSEPGVRGLEAFAATFETPNGKIGMGAVMSFVARHKGRLMMVVDESQGIKTYDALRSKAARAIGRQALIRIAMSGTPIAKRLEDEWSQSMFLSPTIFSFGQVTTFNAQFTRIARENVVNPQTNVIEVRAGDRVDCNIAEFNKIMSPHSHRVLKKDCLDLPAKLYDQFKFDLYPDQRRHYDELKRNFLTKVKMADGSMHKFTVQNAGIARMRLQQIASGLLVDERIDDQTPPVTHILPNARAEALSQLMTKFERGYKVLVWSRFRHDVQQAHNVLGKSGKSAILDGSVPERERHDIIQGFIHGDIDFLSANPAVAGTGIDMTGPNFRIKEVVYYSNADNSVQRWQSEDRVHRIGMKYAVRYTDLIATNTIDLGLLARLKQKKDLAALALGDLEQLLDDENDPETKPDRFAETMRGEHDEFIQIMEKAQ